MIFYAFLNFAFLVIVAVFIYTQIAKPAMENRKLFPIFRKNSIEKAVNELEEVFEDKQTTKLAQQVEQLKKGK